MGFVFIKATGIIPQLLPKNEIANGALVNCLAIFISFTLLLISITQFFHLFLKSFMIKLK